MASVTITVPDQVVPRLVVMARARFPELSGLGDAALFRKVTAEFWRGMLAIYEAGEAVTAGQANEQANEQAIIAQVTAQVMADTAGVG